MVTKAVKNGETFDLPGSEKESVFEETAASVETPRNKKLPPFFIAILPLIIVVAVLNITAKFITPTAAALLGLFAGIMVGLALMNQYSRKYGVMIGKGTENAIIATVNICAVVGYGAVAKNSPAFSSIVDALVSMPGMEYAGLAQ